VQLCRRCSYSLLRSASCDEPLKMSRITAVVQARDSRAFVLGWYVGRVALLLRSLLASHGIGVHDCREVSVSFGACLESCEVSSCMIHQLVSSLAAGRATSCPRFRCQCHADEGSMRSQWRNMRAKCTIFALECVSDLPQACTCAPMSQERLRTSSSLPQAPPMTDRLIRHHRRH
jgi:hypothetical protein